MKVALITGASRGIGYELALALAAQDVTVIAVARSENELRELQEKYPDHIHIVAADVCIDKQREKILDLVHKFGKIDYFINNAAIITPLSSLKDVSQEDLTKILVTNVVAPVMLINKLIPYLSNGRILDLSSPAAYTPVPGLGPYNLTKAAQAMLTKLHCLELSLYNIAVTSVLPGEVDTYMHEQLRETSHPISEEFQQAKKMGKLMLPKVSAAFLAWLLLKTSTKEYEAQQWSIYDQSHRDRWLGKDMLLPLPSKKEQEGFGLKQETQEIKEAPAVRAHL